MYYLTFIHYSIVITSGKHKMFITKHVFSNVIFPLNNKPFHFALASCTLAWGEELLDNRVGFVWFRTNYCETQNIKIIIIFFFFFSFLFHYYYYYIITFFHHVCMFLSGTGINNNRDVLRRPAAVLGIFGIYFSALQLVLLCCCHNSPTHSDQGAEQALLSDSRVKNRWGWIWLNRVTFVVWVSGVRKMS